MPVVMVLGVVMGFFVRMSRVSRLGRGTNVTLGVPLLVTWAGNRVLNRLSFLQMTLTLAYLLNLVYDVLQCRRLGGRTEAKTAIEAFLPFRHGVHVL